MTVGGITKDTKDQPRKPAERKDYVDQILDQWSRERPDLDASPMGTIARIWRLARLSEAATEEIFAEHGLSRGGFDVLAALRRSGAPYELSPTELYSSLLISSGAMTNRIDRLEEMGLVERIPDADDRRGIKVVLTTRGRTVIDDAMRDHLENEHRMLEVLSASELRVLPTLLRELLVHLGDLADPADGSDAGDARRTKAR
jgi:DNA-binding MarR family transcriptional regulator